MRVIGVVLIVTDPKPYLTDRHLIFTLFYINKMSPFITYSLLWTCMSKIKFCSYFSLTILVYGHVEKLWTNQGAKNDDFSLIVSL